MIVYPERNSRIKCELWETRKISSELDQQPKLTIKLSFVFRVLV